MPIEPINLRGKLNQVRRSFDIQLAEVLLERLDLSHTRVMKKFGVSAKVIRRVIRQFNIGARKRGPKTGHVVCAKSDRKQKPSLANSQRRSLP